MSDAEAARPAVDGLCQECGFDYDDLDHHDVPEALRIFGRRYRAPLTRGLPGESLDDLLRAHPLDGVWSALEYACHVRDVFSTQAGRVDQTLEEDSPRLQPMDRDERVEREGYNQQDPEVVGDQLAENAAALASRLEQLTDEQWRRRAVYTYPEPTERDISWIARHTVHEGRHHLLDIGRVLRAARGR